MRTHYDNLKVSPDAPDFVIKASYKALMQKHHPDKFDDEKKRKEALRITKIITDAFDVLSDPIKRAEHDEWINNNKSNDNNHFNIKIIDDGIFIKFYKAIGFLFSYIFIVWLSIRFLLDTFISLFFGDKYKHYIFNSVLKVFSNKALLPANFFITFTSISVICVITYHYLKTYIYEDNIDEELKEKVVLEKIFTKSSLVQVFYTFIGIVILSVTVGGLFGDRIQQLIEHDEPASEQKTVESAAQKEAREKAFYDQYNKGKSLPEKKEKTEQKTVEPQKPFFSSSIPPDQNQPDFKRYPVLTIYDGAPAKVILATPEEKNFRTRLRETQTMPVNFAGEYVFTSWGCGTGCSAGAAVNHRTGKVIFFPYPNFVGSSPCLEQYYEEYTDFEFVSNSRLMQVFGTDKIFGGAGGSELELRFFDFNDDGFKLIKSVPLKCEN
jgi:hypothetical protein